MEKNAKALQKNESTLFMLCWVSYFASYVGRLNFSSALGAMLDASILTRSQGGAVNMMYFYCYGGGMLISGLLGDRLPPRTMIFIGLLGAALANAALPFFPYAPAITALWAFNGFCQSMIWPPIVRTLSEKMRPDSRMKYSIHISSSMPSGTLCCYLLSAATLALFGWRGPFFMASVLLTAAAFFFLSLYKKTSDALPTPPDLVPDATATDAPTAKRVSLFHLFIHAGLWSLLIPVLVNGVLKDGMTSWVPTFLGEQFGSSPIVSVLMTTALPVINLTGAYAAGFVNKRLRNETLCAALFFTFALCCLLALYFAGGLSQWFSLLLLALTTSSMLAINTLLIGIVPMYFGGVGKAASVSGTLNAVAYLGSAIASYAIGVLVDRSGWSSAIFSWVLATAAATLILFLCRKIRFSQQLRTQP